ncbi:hypothetical protein SLEP1_g8205 [Rubroshorea leprosula]|uniref:RING-type E3 ubiquitin transferase n=1 Tax=Rubroshorea leprosula TaxID=152421 RepID=A0AAV5I8V0_9ROSI|nr:hypothetical protein SLEP1_g8205 [Rubroshorea leprosula]
MQGESNSFNPFQEIYYLFNSESGPRILNLLQLMEAPNPQQDPLGQPGFSQEPGHRASFDLLTWERSPSPLPGSRFEGRHFEPNTTPYQGGSSSDSGLHLSNGTPSTFQVANFGAPPGGIDLNLPSIYSPFGPIVLTSRTARYEVDDNAILQNPSADGRHFLLARREPEDASRQLSVGGSSSSSQQAQNYEQQVGIFEQLGVVARGNTSGSVNRYEPLNLNTNRNSLTGLSESSQRNVHYRRTTDFQGYIPTWPSNSVNVQSHSQPTLHFPYDPFLNYASSSAAPFNATPGAQPITQGYNFLQNLHPTQLNGENMFDGFHQEHNSMDRSASYMISPSDFITPVFERGYLENRHWNMNMAFHEAGSLAHGAGIIAANLHAPSTSTFPQTNWANQHIMENLVVNGLESSQGHYHHPMHGVRTTVNQMEVSIGGDHGHASSTQAGQRVARRGVRGPSPRIRSPTAAQRRRRLINEVREALDNFRRVGGEHFLELIVLGEQFEIIANEVEQIQVVENGLTEDTIMARLNGETYHPAEAEEHRACGICLDEYAEGDLLGKLDCGHDYHFECIKQWLMRKNSCPMNKKPIVINMTVAPKDNTSGEKEHHFSKRGAFTENLPLEVDSNLQWPNTAYANNSSNPIVLTSRTTQYEVEDNVNWQNPSPDGSSSSQRAENYEQQAGFFEQLGVAAQGNARGRLNLNANITEQAGSSRRNVRLRTYEQQHSMPTENCI